MKEIGVNALFSLFLLLFTFTFFEGTIHLPVLKMADEVTLLLSIVVLVLVVLGKKISIETRVFVLTLTVYLAFQVVNYYVSPFNLKFGVTILQSLINLKLFIVSIAFVIVALNANVSLKSLKIIALVFALFFLVGLSLNMVFQEKWNVLLNWKTEYRYGFLRPAGIFGATHFNSYFLSFFCLAYYMLHVRKKREFPSLKKLSFFAIFQFLISFPLTIRKGLISLIPLAYFSFRDQQKTLRYLYLFMIAIIVFVVGSLVQDSMIVQDTLGDLTQMTNNDSDNYYIRGLMIYNGVMLSFDFFPFGSGSATFGTVLSQYNTLEVYEYTKIPSFWYNGTELSGVYDSGLFSFLGENGWLGLVILVYIIRNYLRKLKSLVNESGRKYISVLFIFTLIMGVSEPVFQNGIFTVIYSFTILYVLKSEPIKDTKMSPAQ